MIAVVPRQNYKYYAYLGWDMSTLHISNSQSNIKYKVSPSKGMGIRGFLTPPPSSKQMLPIRSFLHLNMIHTQSIENWRKWLCFTFICYLANKQTTLGHYQGDRLTQPIRFSPFLSIFNLHIMEGLIRSSFLGAQHVPTKHWFKSPSYPPRPPPPNFHPQVLYSCENSALK